MEAKSKAVGSRERWRPFIRHYVTSGALTDVLKELSQLGSKMHNGFAGLSAMARSTTATVAEGKEASERTLEVAEKTLAACRVSGPSSSEKEILESLELSLEALKQLVSTPIPPPPNQPVHVPASSHTAPPPPQHAPNLLNITPSSSSGCGGGWGTGPTAAVMLKNPQQIFRVLAGHSGDGSN